MEVYVDNLEMESFFGITVADYTGALSFPAERETAYVWRDKSGIDLDLLNRRYEAKEFVMECICKASNAVAAYNLIQTLITYIHNKGVIVLSLRDDSLSVRECFPCTRSNTIIGNVNVRKQNSIYSFKLGFKDINPDAVKYKTVIVDNSVSVEYTKGVNAIVYWGDGTRQLVTNSGTYTKSDYTLAAGNVDVIIDVDSNKPSIIDLVANFTGDPLTGIIEFAVQFTDTSTGEPVTWSWDFGDGEISSEQNPLHTYKVAGVYTVTLQIFNEAAGSDTETKIAYVDANITDIFTTRDGKTISAYINEPCTLVYKIHPDYVGGTWGANVWIKVWLNHVLLDAYYSPLGGSADLNMNIALNPVGEAYLEIKWFGNTESNQIAQLVGPMYFELKNAGVTLMNNPVSSAWHFDVSGNELTEAGVNYILESSVLDLGLPDPHTRVFNLSGGTNAAPTSVGALSQKALMEGDARYIYSDNS